MKCKMCKNEIESEEIRGTLGMRTGYCCGEVQVDIDSLRPRVKQSTKSYDRFCRKYFLEIMKDSN